MIEGPYGKFLSSGAEEVWVAGGIGITPFIAMACDLDENTNRKVCLFYSVRTSDEFIEMELFFGLARRTNGRFRVYPWITKENGYMKLDNIKKEVGDISRKSFFLCGPDSLKNSFVDALVNDGIPRESIYSEDFSFK